MRRRYALMGAASLLALSPHAIAQVVQQAVPFIGSYPKAAGMVADGVTVSGQITYSYGQTTSGTIAGSLLTVAGSQGTGTLFGIFAVGQAVYVAGVADGATILSLGTGTGGAGTYNLSNSPTPVTGVNISASTNVVTITNAAFAAGDVGKGIRLQGLGLNGIDLIATISAVTNATTITLSTPPLSSVPYLNTTPGTFYGTVTYGTDNSAAILAAHNVAVAAGSRHLWIDPGQYWAGNIQGAANVIYLGEGASFIGTRRYRVHTPTVRSPYAVRRGINATVHLAKLKAQATPLVAFVGDSIGTPNFVGNASIYIAQEINKELRKAYPTKTVKYFDFAIGGCTMSDLASGSEINFAGRGLTKPSWWVSGHTWMYQLQNVAWGAAVQPHTVIIELGTNQITEGAELAALYSVVTQLQAFATAPDIILLTPGVTSLMGFAAGWGNDIAEESRETIGSYWRGFCQRNNIGYIDIGRHVRMLRDGIDVIAENPQTVTPAGLSGNLSLPISLPTCRDFAINWNMTITGPACRSRSGIA